MLHGQNKKTEEPPLALFCLCTPFGPPSLLEIPHKEVMFKSKHKLDFGFVSMDQRGKEMLQYEDEEMSDIGGYDLVHYDDLSYVASAHQECKYILKYFYYWYNDCVSHYMYSRWAKLQVPFSPQKKLSMFYSIFWFQYRHSHSTASYNHIFIFVEFHCVIGVKSQIIHYIILDFNPKWHYEIRQQKWRYAGYN